MSERSDLANGLLGLLVVVAIIILVVNFDGDGVAAFFDTPVQDMEIIDLVIILFWFGICFR